MSDEFNPKFPSPSVNSIDRTALLSSDMSKARNLIAGSIG